MTDAPSGRLWTLGSFASDTPELIVDLAALRDNVERVARAAAAAGVALRPHVKTHKLPEVARMQLEAGAVGIQVAKLGEAEVMIDSGIDDVLIGYPIVGQLKVERLMSLAERASVTVSLDALAVAEPIAAAAAARGISIGLLVELDTGLSRIGVAPGPDAVELAERVAELDGVELIGVLTHEGHAYARAQSPEDLERLTRDACERTVATAEAIRARGIPAPVVSVGSSGTFRFAIEVSGVTEVRPGTYVFNDLTQVALGAATETDLAAVVAATVVSGPRDCEVVLDAGSKALTSDRMIVNHPPATHGAVFTADGRAGEIVRLSEEHGIAAFASPGDAPSIGDRVVIVPNHVCPVINLFETATIVRDGNVVDRWSVAARGKLR
jgi:D-serine deaminase-like pyridoxal phosphate-dependent protein